MLTKNSEERSRGPLRSEPLSAIDLLSIRVKAASVFSYNNAPSKPQIQCLAFVCYISRYAASSPQRRWLYEHRAPLISWQR